MNILENLKKYWGYDGFRPLQEDIIQSVLEGNDTLALLPTGGGKSICFQIPALETEGVCLVISPLIALMKDQVENLNQRGISAAAIFSGMDKRLIDKQLDECIQQKIKFLYVSPERLKTELFVERVKRMKVNLLAIDEAHCISQWGYDFRPPYLEIAEFRKLIPQVPVIALTATATEKVKVDIQERLSFKAQKKVFQKSFARANLAYIVLKEENKEQRLLQIFQKVQGTAVVYVKSRKRTQEIAEMLIRKGISADFYHAGLTHQQRNYKQENWIQNKIRVIVATNAFGMGIDKPDVRVVVHLDLPNTLEAYYQEAGRAGRDEQKAYAVVLYQAKDLDDLAIQWEQHYPSEDFIRQVYQALANYFQLPIQAGEWAVYEFDISDFQKKFDLKGNQTYYALKKLEEQGFIQFNEFFFNPSKVMILLNYQELYEFILKNPGAEPILNLLRRLYGGGILGNYTTIYETAMAQQLQIKGLQVVRQLERLQELQVLEYIPQKEKPQITFLTPRFDVRHLPLDIQKMEERKQNDWEKIQAVRFYIQHQNRCRTQLLLEYFGEISYESCGICDICLKKKKSEIATYKYKLYQDKILQIVQHQPISIQKLAEHIPEISKQTLAEVMGSLIDVGLLYYQDDGKIAIHL